MAGCSAVYIPRLNAGLVFSMSPTGASHGRVYVLAAPEAVARLGIDGAFSHAPDRRCAVVVGDGVAATPVLIRGAKGILAILQGGRRESHLLGQAHGLLVAAERPKRHGTCSNPGLELALEAQSLQR